MREPERILTKYQNANRFVKINNSENRQDSRIPRINLSYATLFAFRFTIEDC